MGAKDLSQVDGALERAHSFLKEMHQHHSRPDIDHDGSECDNEGRAVVDLDEEVEHALEVVHEMEMTLDELRSEQSHRDRLSPSSKQASMCSFGFLLCACNAFDRNNTFQFRRTSRQKP